MISHKSRNNFIRSPCSRYFNLSSCGNRHYTRSLCTVVASHPVDRAVPAVVGDVAGGVPLASRVGERVGVERGRSGRRRLAAAVARVVLIDLGNVLVSMQWP